MRALILGAGGMLGHKLYQIFQDRFETWGTVRGKPVSYSRLGIFDIRRLIGGVEATYMDSVVRAFATARPDVVVNCIGIIKQLKESKECLPSISINALFPHRLAELCKAAGARMIHMSTDCVFSGRKGNYSEGDVPDAEDLYGRTKLLGEVTDPECLTLRTSIIGLSLQPGSGLVDWFLGQRGKTVHGYVGAIYSGLTTLALGQVIADVLEQHSELNGLWHVSADPISKYDLLRLVNEAFDLKITIERDESFFCDSSLDSSRFREATRFRPPAWPDMIARMAADKFQYQDK
ncbi:MAG: dTDP-4-dehydrorhamnose reductase family protein [Desulfomonilaceae bacterium]